MFLNSLIPNEDDIPKKRYEKHPQHHNHKPRQL